MRLWREFSSTWYFLGLAPKENFQIAVADMIVDRLSGIENKGMTIVEEFDPEKRVKSSFISLNTTHHIIYYHFYCHK